MKKRILILTASFGEGHNSAARGNSRCSRARRPGRDRGRTARFVCRSLWAGERLVRKSYLAGRRSSRLAHGVPFIVGSMARERFRFSVRAFLAARGSLRRSTRAFSTRRDDLHVPCLSEAYPKNSGAKPRPLAALQKRRCSHGFRLPLTRLLYAAPPPDYFLVANEQSASVLQTAGVAVEKIKVFGFPVSPKFADSARSKFACYLHATPSAVFYT